MIDKEQIIMNLDVYNQHKPELYYVYAHFKPNEDKPYYVGKGKKLRFCSFSGRCSYWKNIVAKYGLNVKFLEINLTEEEALLKEKEYIAKFKRLSEGGTLVNVLKGGWVSINELNKIKSQTLQNRMVGGKREKYFGRKLIGKDNPNFGNKGALNPLSKPVVKLTLDGEYVIQYSSAAEAAEKENCCASAVTACCKRKRHQLKGFVWVYLEDYQNNNYKITFGPTNRIPVYQLDFKTKNIIKRYNCSHQTKQDGFLPCKVTAVCKGQRNIHKGYSWCYVSEYQNKKDIVETLEKSKE